MSTTRLTLADLEKELISQSIYKMQQVWPGDGTSDASRKWSFPVATRFSICMIKTVVNGSHRGIVTGMMSPWLLDNLKLTFT